GLRTGDWGLGTEDWGVRSEHCLHVIPSVVAGSVWAGGAKSKVLGAHPHRFLKPDFGRASRSPRLRIATETAKNRLHSVLSPQSSVLLPRRARRDRPRSSRPPPAA